MLWLYQRHALKAFRASVGDGNSILVALRRSVPLFSLCNIRTAPTQIQLLDHFAQLEFNSDMKKREFYIDLIGKYGELLESRKGYISRESDLPVPKSEIRNAIEWARTDPVFSMGGKALDVGWELLDTFMPDEEYEQISQQFDEAITALMSGENDRYQNIVTKLSESQKLLVAKIFKIASL